MIHTLPQVAGSEDTAEPTAPLASILEIVNEARAGRPYLLIGAEDRDGEGDLVIPAQMAAPDQVNFMAKHARGLICLAMTAERARQLRLPPMVQDDGSSRGAGFTVSIEARQGVTTGISAHDRARTIAVAIDPGRGPSDLVCPGHVFPVASREGGVLRRPGRAEAAVDISRIAGLYPAAVACEVMNDDGSMARLPELIAFARQHRLKIGSAEDLVAYRLRTERHLERILERPLDHLHGGAFTLFVYRNALDGVEHAALVKGPIDPDRPTLSHLHRVDFLADLLEQADGRQGGVLAVLARMVAWDGAGVMVLIREPGTPWRSDVVSQSLPAKTDAGRVLDSAIARQILSDLGVGETSPVDFAAAAERPRAPRSRPLTRATFYLIYYFSGKRLRSANYVQKMGDSRGLA